MAATHHSLAQPVHDAERQAIRFIVEGLPDGYTVYSNAWLVERSGGVYELDAIVAAPHAIFVVEIKSFRNEIRGNDFDWYIPEPFRSPLRLNYKTAQVLASLLRRRSHDAGNAWVEGYVFLSHTNRISVQGDASRVRLHTRKSLIPALTDAQSLYRRLRYQPGPVDDHTRETLERLLAGASPKYRPSRRVREYVLESVVERTEHYLEHLVRHDVSGVQRVLRVYPLPALEEEADRRRKEERWRWEAQVLARVGQHPYILTADQPFLDEAGMCLPFEHFSGISLTSWLERYKRGLTGQVSLHKRIGVWMKVVEAILYAHQQGVVHRLLRPESVMVQDTMEDPDVRLIGFDLAKQLASPTTVHVSSLQDDRLVWAAPEVIQDFSRAETRSDQFSLGAMLGLILAGRPLFESTQSFIQAGNLVVSIRDLNPTVPKTLDDVVKKMLAYRPEDRYQSLTEALAAVNEVLARLGQRSSQLALGDKTNPEDLPKGTRIGLDYEILDTLGAGGLATVYLARHLVSGSSRALKVAREADGADDALLAEYQVLRQLDHRNIVHAVDLSNILPPRKTLILERLKGVPLSRWLLDQTQPELRLLQRYAEDLLGALIYLAEQDVTHKDLKPDNLIVGNDGLTVIDFSLARVAPDQLLVGTPLYRDPAIKRWDHAADRYAAALCLFELYTARHAFDGHAPAPGQQPLVEDGEFEAPGLAHFFRKALHPSPERRYPSALAMRAAFQEALGTQSASESNPPVDIALDPHALLSAEGPSALGLSPGWLASLRRAGIYTRLELAAAEEERLGRIRGLGSRGRGEVLALRASVRASLQEAGIDPDDAGSLGAPPLMGLLVGDITPIQRLGLSTRLTEALVADGLRTVGDLAAATRVAVQAVPQVGNRAVQRVVEALQRFSERQQETRPVSTLEDLWERFTSPLSQRQREIFLLSIGFEDPPLKQQEIAERLALTQPLVSQELRAARNVLDKGIVLEVVELLEVLLDHAGGLQRLDAIISTLTERWPVASDRLPQALLTALVALNGTRLALLDGIQDVPVPLLVRPWFTQTMLAAFTAEAHRLAELWPIAIEKARRSLATLLPEYTMDPLSLAVRLMEHVELLPRGELAIPPIEVHRALAYILGRSRPPISLEQLRAAVENNFGDIAIWPAQEALPATFARPELREFRLEGDRVVTSSGRSISPQRLTADELPSELRQVARAPEEVVGDLLRNAAQTRGYRLIVTPPERHAEIGRSVAQGLGLEARFLSFEHLLLERLEDDFGTFDRAERFPADRELLTEQAEQLLEDLLAEHGRPGKVNVLGDTAILQLCEALHLIRTLYDETLTGSRGFWALVIPGVIAHRQPRFNEREEVFHLDGVTLPLAKEIPAG